jgi:hypothetical protein
MNWKDWSVWRKVVVVGLIVLACFGFAVCVATMQEGMGKFDSPERVAKDAIMALESRDADNICQYFTPIPSNLMRARIAPIFANVDAIKIKNLNIVLISNEGIAARVRANFDMLITRDQYIETQHLAKNLKLVCIDGKWYLNEAFM